MKAGTLQRTAFGLCKADSYAKTAELLIKSCEKVPPKEKLPALAVGGMLERLKSMKERYRVKVDQELFYKLGGGQPSDSGFIGEARCEYVEPDEENPNGPGIHWLDRPLEVGQTYTGTIDWDRRWYHMQSHTMQHVISAVGYDLWGQAPTISWDLGRSEVVVDFKLKEEQKDLQVPEYERRMNEIIVQNKPIKLVEVAGDDSDGALTQLANDPKSRESVPEKGKFNIVRLVEIEGIDINPCGGTHTRSTGELQMVKVLDIGMFKGNLRVTFICGNTLFNKLSSLVVVESGLNKLLSVQAERFVERVEGALQANTASRKQAQRYEFELARLKASSFATSEQSFVRFHVEEGDLALITSISKQYNSVHGAEGKAVLWLTCSTAGNPNEGAFILYAQDKESAQRVDAMSKACGEQIKSILGGRGGGGKGKWQGKGSNMTGHVEAGDVLEAYFKTLLDGTA